MTETPVRAPRGPLAARGAAPSREEAAWTDGASGLRALCRLVPPLRAPGTAVVAVFTLLGPCGDFLLPYELLQSPEKQPAAVHLGVG